MRVFAINLAHRTDKKDSLLRQAEALHLPLEWIDAINGQALSVEDLRAQVQDYPRCALTKGVIGCALSHLKVYEKMVREEVSLALVLEDDVILTPELPGVLRALEAIDHNEEPRVYLLSSHHYRPKPVIPLDERYSLHAFIDGSAAHAYVLNLKAAQSLDAHLHPVVWEADKWYYFEQLGLVHVFCVVPHVLDANGAVAYSDLFQERSVLVKKRRHYLRRLKKVVPWSEKVKKFLWKATRRPFVHKS